MDKELAHEVKSQYTDTRRATQYHMWCVMSQNTSTAVMARRKEPHDSLDDFPTPPWATRALCKHILGKSCTGLVWEPACNRGHMSKPLAEYFGGVITSDVHDYGYGHAVEDFLMPSPLAFAPPEWIITNPPFRLAEQFALRAIEIASIGVALFVRAGFLESIGRYERLFTKHPPTIVAQFTERVVLHKGNLAPDGSSATSYVWIVWIHELKDQTSPAFGWIPPCRKQLERPEDYT